MQKENALAAAVSAWRHESGSEAAAEAVRAAATPATQAPAQGGHGAGGATRVRGRPSEAGQAGGGDEAAAAGGPAEAECEAGSACRVVAPLPVWAPEHPLRAAEVCRKPKGLPCLFAGLTGKRVATYPVAMPPEMQHTGYMHCGFLRSDGCM